MQVGVQGMSDDSYETANQYVKDGALGNVVIAQIDYSRNGDDIFCLRSSIPTRGRARISTGRPGSGQAPKRAWDPVPLLPLAQLLGLLRRHRHAICSSTASRASSSRSA